MTKKITDQLTQTSSQLSEITDIMSFLNDETTQKFIKKVEKANQQLQEGLKVISLSHKLVDKTLSVGEQIASGQNIAEIASSLLGNSTLSNQITFTLAIAGLNLKASLLEQSPLSVISFELKEHYHSLYELTIQFASSDPALDAKKILESPAYFEIRQQGQILRQVSGIVADFEQGDTGFHQTFYRVQVVPSLWRLQLRRNSRIFQQKNITEILTALLSENGIEDYAFAFKDTHQTREYCVQWQETDFDFLQRLTAEEGLFYYFEHTEHTHTIVFADTSETIGDKITLPYNLNKNAQLQEKCVTHFRQRERIRYSSATLKDYTFKKPDWPAQFQHMASDLDYQQNAYEYYDYPARFKATEQGKAFSRYRLESLRNDAHIGYGESNAAELEVGRKLQLQQHPNPKYAQLWQIVSVRMEGSQTQGTEHIAEEQGSYLHNTFEVIPYHQTWRPRQHTKPRVDGPQMAIVVGPKGEEIFTDNFGRVRLQFLWDREGKNDDHSSCWIRVTQPWAGQGWGALSIPRVGQEVLVDFLDGDPDQPIVTGRAYHARNIPPGQLPNSLTHLVISSQTYKGKGANSLIFDDMANKQKVDIYAQKDMNVEVLNDQKTAVHQQREICVLAGNQTTEIQQGHLFEKIGQSKQIEANAIYQVAKASLTGKGEQFFQADDQITLKVGDNGIVLDKQRLRLTFGAFSLELNESGIFIDGELVRTKLAPHPDEPKPQPIAALTPTKALTVLGAYRPPRSSAMPPNTTNPAEQVSQPTTPQRVEKSPQQQSKEDAILGAYLSKEVYHPRGTPLSPELLQKYPNLHEVSDEELDSLNIKPDMLSDKKSGFQANIYKNNDQYFVVYRGTEFAPFDKTLETYHDVKADIDGATGRPNPQFEKARDLAKRLKRNLPDNSRMSIAGHSLGGQLASIGGLATGVPTYTYNAAGLHPDTIKELGLQIENEKYITAFYTDKDLLHSIQQNRKLIALGAMATAPIAEPLSWLLGHSSTAIAFDALLDDDIPTAIGTQIELKTGTGHTIEATKEITQAIEDYFNR